MWGDQQVKAELENMYAATLAACSLWTFMAIAARFSLELKQYDTINAFVHAKLDETVFMKMPDRYWKTGHILKLHKALYGIAMLSYSLAADAEIGSASSRFQGDSAWTLLHGAKRNSHLLLCQRHCVCSLKKEFELSEDDPLQWFLGIEIIQDRKKKLHD